MERSSVFERDRGFESGLAENAGFDQQQIAKASRLDYRRLFSPWVFLRQKRNQADL